MENLDHRANAVKNGNASSYLVPTEFKAALQAKCPKCRRGNIFANSMYGFKAQKMNIHCPHCDLKFEREPGYFYVSMFVSYAFNVAQMISIAVATYVLTGNLENIWLYIFTIFPGVLLLAPFNYRYSRVVLLYWLSPGLHYDPAKSKDRPYTYS
ncbi:MULTISPECIES: DUF983 domain-containing protein [Sphingobacterium]|uniref:DUF983 domain-containing protein n=1 Tax=Sphingobacterium populi TaxID=1812824 RepID=A0ABW5UF01_9SPHI|nr:DUF983 domain-containing protein [Sphingobacterium sp. CFCC 11742]